MDALTYQKEATRTEPIYGASQQPCQNPATPFERVHSLQENGMRLLHAAFGISTEAGELLDAIKKEIFYGKNSDIVNIKEEISDVLWYCAIACDAMGTDLEEVMKINIDKLRARFPEKFTEENAQNRDLNNERQVMENAIANSEG